MKKVVEPAEYQTLALELFRVADLTDALGIERAAQLLHTTKRAIYTVRNTNVMSSERAAILINEIRKDEAKCRGRLVQKRNLQLVRAEDVLSQV